MEILNFARFKKKRNENETQLLNSRTQIAILVSTYLLQRLLFML